MCSKQIYRQNLQLESSSDYFGATVTELLGTWFRDQILRGWANSLSQVLYYIIPLVVFGTPNKLRKEFLVFANFDSEDLPSINSLDSGLDVFFTHCKNLAPLLTCQIL